MKYAFDMRIKMHLQNCFIRASHFARLLFETIIERLHASAQVKMVYGEPVSAEDRTTIPVAKIRYGFGGGFGATPSALEEGGGGGGGVMATPVGLIEITSQETRYIAFEEKQRFLAAVAAGFLLAMMLGRKRRRPAKSPCFMWTLRKEHEHEQ